MELSIIYGQRWSLEPGGCSASRAETGSVTGNLPSQCYHENCLRCCQKGGEKKPRCTSDDITPWIFGRPSVVSDLRKALLFVKRLSWDFYNNQSRQ